MPNPFHAGYKLAWLEQVARDRETSDFHVRVAIAVSRRADRTGIAVAGQEGLANFIGATSRGVRNALRDLGALNHIQRQDTGNGGRGVVGQYRLVLRVDGKEDDNAGENGNGGTRNVESHGGRFRNTAAENREQAGPEPGMEIPPLPYSSLESLDPNCSNGRSAILSDWGNILEKATERYGCQALASWFAKLEVVGLEDDVGIIAAQNRFIADHVSVRYGDQILRWWKQRRPSVKRIRFVVRPS